jgi:hypothetical protein
MPPAAIPADAGGLTLSSSSVEAAGVAAGVAASVFGSSVVFFF